MMLIQRLFKKETIAESASIILIFTVLQRIIQTARGIIFARFLGPTNYGVYTLAFFFIPLVVTFAKLGIPSCFSRYIPQYEKKGMLKDFLKKNYLLILSSSLFITFICIWGSRQISSLIFASTRYQNIIILCSITAFLFAVFESFEWTFKGLRVFKLSTFLHFSHFFIFTSLGILLVIFFPMPEFVILASLISSILVIPLFAFVIGKFLRSEDNSQNLKIEENRFYRKILKFSVWFIISPLVFTLFSYTDRWMLNRFMGLDQVGIYSVATNITGLLFMFGTIAGNVVTPNISNFWEQGQKNKAISILDFAIRTSTLFILFSAVFLTLFKEQIVNLLYGIDYINSISVIGILVIFWLFNGISWTLKEYAALIEKTHIPFISNSIGLICNVILNYILIPQFGIKGAAFATTFSFGFASFILYLWLKKEGLRLKLNTILVCLLPLMFIFNKLFIIIVFLFLFVVIFATGLIISKEEKRTLFQQVRIVVLRFRKS